MIPIHGRSGRKCGFPGLRDAARTCARPLLLGLLLAVAMSGQVVRARASEKEVRAMAAQALDQASAHIAAGRYRDALLAVEQAERITRDRAADFDLWVAAAEWRVRLANEFRAEQPTVAIARRFREGVERHDGVDPEQIIVARHLLALTLAHAGERDEAAGLLDAEEARLRDAAVSPKLALLVLGVRGELQMLLSDFVAAARSARQALHIAEQRLPDMRGARSEPLRLLAKALRETGDAAGAEKALREALGVSESERGATHPEVARDLEDYARFLIDSDRLDEAERLQRRAAAILAESLGASHVDHLSALASLGTILLRRNLAGEAQTTFRRAADGFLASNEPAPAMSALTNLMAALRAQGLRAQAKAAALEAETLAATHSGRGLFDEATLATLALFTAEMLLEDGAPDRTLVVAAQSLNAVVAPRRDAAAILNRMRLVAARAHGALGDDASARAMTREAGAAPFIGEVKDRSFVEDWASLTARHAWRLSC